MEESQDGNIISKLSISTVTVSKVFGQKGVSDEMREKIKA